MDCTTTEEEEVCSRHCRNKGRGYGRCEFSECNCFGRRPQPSFAGRRDDSDDDEDFGVFTSQFLGRHDFQQSVPAASGQRKRPLACTAKLSAVGSSASIYDQCAEWCQQSGLRMFMGLDNLCCCEKLPK